MSVQSTRGKTAGAAASEGSASRRIRSPGNSTGAAAARILLSGLLALAPVTLLVALGVVSSWHEDRSTAVVLVLVGLAQAVAFVLWSAHLKRRQNANRSSADAELQRSERRLRDLIDQAPDGIFVADLEGRYTDVNHAGCRMLGFSREQIVGKTIIDVIPAEDVDRLWRAREELLRGGRQVAEWNLKRHDGSLLPVEVSAKILADGRWQGFVRDITERKSNEAALERAFETERRLRAWLRTTIDQMPAGVILLDGSGRVAAMNEAAASLSCGDTGTLDPYGNQVIFDVRDADGRAIPFDELPLVEALRSGEVTRAKEFFLRQGNGLLVPILVNAAPVRDERGQINGAVLLIQDVTALKELERLREEWASVVAHDLRQPVSTISLAAELLAKLRPDGRLDNERRALERIHSASRRLGRMISDLSDASRIEAKRLSLHLRMADVREVIDSVVEELHETTDAFRVQVAAATGLWAWMDPDRIHQVLENLVSNATRYATPGTEILIRAVSREEVVELSVTNHGQGIPPEQMRSLFSRFGRPRDARGGRTSGLGLGLYISRGLVEAHGERLWVESVPGGTTTFSFTVPAGPHAPDFAAAAEARPPF